MKKQQNQAILKTFLEIGIKGLSIKEDVDKAFECIVKALINNYNVIQIINEAADEFERDQTIPITKM